MVANVHNSMSNLNGKSGKGVAVVQTEVTVVEAVKNNTDTNITFTNKHNGHICCQPGLCVNATSLLSDKLLFDIINK